MPDEAPVIQTVLLLKSIGPYFKNRAYKLKIKEMKKLARF
jgi:hypothetical protein